MHTKRNSFHKKMPSVWVFNFSHTSILLATSPSVTVETLMGIFRVAVTVIETTWKANRAAADKIIVFFFLHLHIVNKRRLQSTAKGSDFVPYAATRKIQFGISLQLHNIAPSALP